MIHVEELVKVFPTTDGDDKAVVNRLSFGVARGEIYGLLGPNGAGKTTTLRIIAALLAPTSGRVHVGGFDVTRHPQHVKRCLGYLTASTGLYQRLSPREMLQYFGRLCGLDEATIARRVTELTDWLDMGRFVDLRCGSLSTGQKQRTSIARALIADPPVLILDEPTLGLDVLTNRLIIEFIRAQQDLGKTIILSTHYLDEAQSLCHRFGLLHEGRLIAEGNLDHLQRLSGQQRLTDIFLHLCGEHGPVLQTASAAATDQTDSA